MIVPDFWAEARRQHRAAGKQVTVRRFGWSETSQADAQAMAESRVEEALERILSGAKIPRRELKEAYNGADGLPIREEVLERHGADVITRNSYGARCLNTENALFADVDLTRPDSCGLWLLLQLVLWIASAAVGWKSGQWWIGVLLAIGSLGLTGYLVAGLLRIVRSLTPSPEQVARQRIDRFITRHPDWSFRLYRTPNGFRLLVTHRPFTVDEPEVEAFLGAIGADPIYVRMCLNQKCFRARLTAKPWRIGITSHMRPRPGVWPVREERRAERSAWIADYEARARDYAACRFEESLGPVRIDPQLDAVIRLHDLESGALRLNLPLA